MPSEFKENAEDLNTGDSVQVDVNAIRARLDAARGLGRSNPAYLDALENITRHMPRLLDENARLNAELDEVRSESSRLYRSLQQTAKRVEEALAAELDRVTDGTLDG